MASDSDYMSFLDKANKDPTEGHAETARQSGSTAATLKAMDEGATVPKALGEVQGQVFYVSDADEPFEAVALGWKAGKGLPDEDEFAHLVEHWDPEHAEIEIMDPVDWDARGQYKEVVEAVRKAGEGNDVRVYRVKTGGVEVEYWVVTTEGKGKDARLVGLKALAVES